MSMVSEHQDELGRIPDILVNGYSPAFGAPRARNVIAWAIGPGKDSVSKTRALKARNGATKDMPQSRSSILIHLIFSTKHEVDEDERAGVQKLSLAERLWHILHWPTTGASRDALDKKAETAPSPSKHFRMNIGDFLRRTELITTNGTFGTEHFAPSALNKSF